MTFKVIHHEGMPNCQSCLNQNWFSQKMKNLACKQANQAVPAFASDIDKLQTYLQQCPNIKQAILFGSLAKGCAGFESDVDVAVQMDHTMSAQEKIYLIDKVALMMGRTVDLIDLNVVGHPLLGQIMQYGKRLVGEDAVYATLLSRCVIDQADFLPYRQCILDERRRAWIGC